MPGSLPPDPYEYPRYWDLAFSDETLPEADFLESVAKQYLRQSAARVLEVACGGGRQVIEMAQRGFDVTGFDLSPVCVKYVRQRLSRAKLPGVVCCADMTQFSEHDLLSASGLPRELAGAAPRGTPFQPFDLAHCLVNSFRHLTTESVAISHLESVSALLRPGGIYVLGFHLMPPDADEEDCERWTIRHRSLRITTTVRVLEFSRRRRVESVRFSLRVRSPKIDLRLRTDHRLRIYRADQFRSLLRKVPTLKLRDVYDFCYDISEPLRLNDELGDAVFVLQRV